MAGRADAPAPRRPGRGVAARPGRSSLAPAGGGRRPAMRCAGARSSAIVDGAEQDLPRHGRPAARWPANAPEAYTLVVREALRGALPDERRPADDGQRSRRRSSTAAATCSTYGITTHLVLALDVPAFDGGEPDHRAVAAACPTASLVGGHDDGADDWADLDAFRAALAGEPFATPGPDTRRRSPTPVDRRGAARDHRHRRRDRHRHRGGRRRHRDRSRRGAARRRPRPPSEP